VDKRALLDLETFYDIEYDIVRGYYFDDGFNVKIKEFIQKLAELRSKYKKAKNPIQNTIKLLMNSIYGKSIMKPIEKDMIVVDEADLEKYQVRYYNYIKGIEPPVNGKVFIERIRTIDNHFIIPQFGVSVLSWSKHLMNKVICTAEQNGIDIFYTDTDSIHIREADISKLAEIYKNKYGSELIGSNLTQFHTDFDPVNGKPSHSVSLIVLGKKCYLDVLENEDHEQDYHVRMKGIPEQVLKNYCQKQKIDLVDLYIQLYEGDRIKFDLKDGSAAFKMTKSFDQITRETFTRTIHLG
jgi:DNA polymerase elongation subunit (family B)